MSRRRLGATQIALALTVLFVGTLLFSPGCAGLHETIPDAMTRRESAETLAHESGFRRLPLGDHSTKFLPVVAWFRPRPGTPGKQAPPARVHIYIEGDGLAWKSRRQPSDNPTPTQPIALMLAAADPTTASTIYLGRPCQYEMPKESDCRPIFWTAGRYGEAVLESMNRSIDLVLEKLGEAGPIDLIGYSGGGVIAALLGARRTDVRLLVTIAAPLDVRGWTQQARVSPLLASQSPMDEIVALRKIRQHHFVGGKDRSVPLSVTRSFHLALGENAPSNFTIVDEANHNAWPAHWPSLVMASRLAD